MKTYQEYLNEGKQVGIIYHYTDFRGLIYILDSGVLKPWTEKTIDDKRPYISFTRIKPKNIFKNFNKFQNNIGKVIYVGFEFDGDNLSNRYKIEPYEYGYMNHVNFYKKIQ